MKNKSVLSFWKIFQVIFFSAIILFLAWNAFHSLPNMDGSFSTKRKILLLAFEGVYLLIWLVGLLVFLIPQQMINLREIIIKLRQSLYSLRWLASFVFVLLPSFLFLYTPLGTIISSIYLRISIYLVSTLFSACFLTNDRNKTISFPSLGLALLAANFVLVLTSEFQSVVSYPFSLHWSEGNRFWDYSVLFGSRRYNFPANQEIYAFIERGRQTLWGIPFLIPGVPIWGIRFWNAFVFTFPYALLGWMLFRKQDEGIRLWFFVGLWAMLFLNQGPIYTPLVLSAILVAGARDRSLWISAPLVALAGYYAQITRWTWMFAPAMWVGFWTLGLGELKDGKISKRVWIRSISLVGSGLFGCYYLPPLGNIFRNSLVAAQNISLVSVEGGKGASQQPLIWSRLWPNPTFAPGIILGLVLAIAPLVLLMAYLLISKRWTINRWQGITLVGGLLAFLVVGLIISTKIGGGSNLHNLDMFLIGLLFAAAIAWEKGGAEWLEKLDFSSWQGLFLLAAVAIPAYFPLMKAGPLDLPDKKTTQSVLQRVQEEVSQAAEHGEVLFMDQRQLLTFGYVEQVPLVTDYEKKYIMNKTMSADTSYFMQYYQDLAQPRFSLIITEVLKINYREEGEYNFAAENNTWVKWVSEPTLCFYEPIETFEEVGVMLLKPREDISDCVKYLE